MLLKLFLAFEYQKKFKNMPDSYIYDKLLLIASLRNMDGLIVSQYGGINAKYATRKLEQNVLANIFESIWTEVKTKFPRKYWYYEVNKRMANIQKGKCKKTYDKIN